MRRLLTLAAALCALAAPASAQNIQTALFAGGCFWCVESDFDKVEGVRETISGYTGGEAENPSYRQVVAGGTGHVEAVKITYDADIVSYIELLHIFWRSVDPTDDGGQFCDRGDTYRTAIFVADEGQKATARASRAKAEEALGQEIVTRIELAGTFYPAEAYHQDFYRKNPLRYKAYRTGCRRDARVKALWGAEAAFQKGS